MEADDAYLTVKSLVNDFADDLGNDLAAAVAQQRHTTKLDRRQRALAYLLETLTGGMERFPDEDWVLRMLDLVAAFRANAKAGEVLVALDRTERRLRHALATQAWVRRTCVACGDPYTPDHRCADKHARAKDATMSRE